MSDLPDPVLSPAAPSDSVTIVWCSPSFEREYAHSRPGVRIPDPSILERFAAEYAGPVTAWLVDGASTDDVRALEALGFDRLDREVPLTGRILVLGHPAQELPVLDGAQLDVIAAALLPAPTESLDPREAVREQVQEMVLALLSRSSEAVPAEVVHMVLRRALTGIDDRLAALGVSLPTFASEVAVAAGFHLRDGQYVKLRERFTLGEVVSYGVAGVELTVVNDSGRANVLCVVPESMPLALVPANRLSSTGQCVPVDEFTKALARAAVRHQKIPLWAGPANGQWQQGAHVVQEETGVEGVALSASSTDVFPVDGEALPASTLSGAHAKGFAATGRSGAGGVSVVSMQELDESHAWVVYRPLGPKESKIRSSLKGGHAPAVAVRVGDLWRIHPVSSQSTGVPLRTADGAPVLIRDRKGQAVPAFVSGAYTERAINKEVVLLDLEVDSAVVRLLSSRASGQTQGLPVEVTPGDVVVTRHGDRNKRDVMAVFEVGEDGVLVGVCVATAERSAVLVADPQALGVQEGAGWRLAKKTVHRNRVESVVGRCPDADWEQLAAFRSWLAGRLIPEPGQVVWSVRPGEEQRPPRPSMVVRATPSGYVCRPMTASPHRVQESGYELQDPHRPFAGSGGSKVRDYEILVEPEQVRGLSGRLSERDLAGALGCPASQGPSAPST